MNASIDPRVLIFGAAYWLVFSAFLLAPFPIETTTYITSTPEEPPFAVAGAKHLLLGYVFLTLVLFLHQSVAGKGFSSQFLHYQVITSSVPLTVVLLVAAFLAYARLRIGDLPLPHQPPPRAIGLHLGHFHMGLILLVAVCIAIYLFVHSRGWIKWTSARIRVLGQMAVIGCWLALFFILKYDPLYFFDWLGG